MENPTRYILIVEDNPDDAEMVAEQIEKTDGFLVKYKRVETEQDYRIALADQSWDMVVSDWNLPTFNGLRAFEILQSFGLNMPFILISGVASEEDIGKARARGVREYLSKQNLSAIGEIIKDELQRAADYESQIKFFADVLGMRDNDTEGHSERVAALTVELALLLGVKHTELVHIRRGALLHDIGKIKVPDIILFKPDKLTDSEFEVMKQHPVTAYEAISKVEFLKRSIAIPYYHHEKWDGSGYPRGLKGEEIPLHARIFSVVDVYDALTNNRPYRKAWTRERALRHIFLERNISFDPKVADVFIEMMESRDA